MIAEINIGGIFVSPLLLCLVGAFLLRLLFSRVLSWSGAYRLIAQRPMFNSAMFLVFVGLLFYALKLVTTP